MSADCQQTRELMDSYLSGELSVETNHQVLHHLGTCAACAAEARRRERMRALLAQSLDQPLDVDRMRGRIASALDREERSWPRAARWIGAAAALLVGVAAAFWLSRPVDASAYDDSAENHVACGLATPAWVTYDPERVARHLEPPYKEVAEAIGLTHGPYQVIEAHMCPYKGHDYAHVVLRGDGRTLSLFIEQALRGALPAATMTTRLPDDALDVHSTERQGYRVSAADTRDHRIFVVDDRPSDAPREFVNEILRSAAKFVRTLER